MARISSSKRYSSPSSSSYGGERMLMWVSFAVLVGIAIWLIVVIAKHNDHKKTNNQTPPPPPALKQILSSPEPDATKKAKASSEGFEIKPDLEGFRRWGWGRGRGRGRGWGWRPRGGRGWNYWYAPYTYGYPVYNYTTPNQCQFFDAVKVNNQCPSWLPKQSVDSEGRSICCSA